MGSQLRSKLVRRIDRRIDVPSELFLSYGYRVHDFLEWRSANHQEVDIACRAKLTPCGRSEHESDLDPIAQRRKSVAHNVNQSRSLRKQPAQFREDWRIAVCLEVDLTSLNGATQQSCRGQELQFSLHRADSRPSLTGDLPKVVRLVRVTQQPGEDPTARAAEQHGGRVHR
jgi:hypothetical protein